jgi:hypothetical protein
MRGLVAYVNRKIDRLIDWMHERELIHSLYGVGYKYEP